MRRTAWDYVGNSDVLGHDIVKHRTGQNVSELVDTFWSQFWARMKPFIVSAR